MPSSYCAPVSLRCGHFNNLLLELFHFFSPIGRVISTKKVLTVTFKTPFFFA